MNTSFSLYSPSIWSLTEEERVYLESIKQISYDTASSSSETDEIELICASLPFIDIDNGIEIEDCPGDEEVRSPSPVISASRLDHLNFLWEPFSQNKAAHESSVELGSMKIVELEGKGFFIPAFLIPCNLGNECKKNAVGSSDPVLINDHVFDKSDWQSRKIIGHKMESPYSLSKPIQ